MLKLHYVLEQAVLGGVWQEFLMPIKAGLFFKI